MEIGVGFFFVIDILLKNANGPRIILFFFVVILVSRIVFRTGYHGLPLG